MIGGKKKMTSAEGLAAVSTGFAGLALVSNLLMSYFIERAKEKVGKHRWQQYGDTAFFLAVCSLFNIAAGVLGALGIALLTGGWINDAGASVIAAIVIGLGGLGTLMAFTSIFRHLELKHGM
ncbi:MAG: hypothetical protein NT137_03655 [Methanomassiliicoccales archaeon]|nr:hypothetical protein [Methanomassiliicoccales archaeon]